MEIAQEEVLTCLGVHLHDRFFRIQQKLKVEGKAWQLLFAISVDTLRRNIEVQLFHIAFINSVNTCIVSFGVLSYRLLYSLVQMRYA